MDTSKINFETLDASLFDTVAQEIAQKVAANSDKNKQTQVRKFYDEICMWEMKIEDKIEDKENKFEEYKPFIFRDKSFGHSIRYNQERASIQIST